MATDHGAEAQAAPRRSVLHAGSCCLQPLFPLPARTRLFQLFFPASPHYPFIQVSDPLSAFSAGALQFLVISLPHSHMKTNIQRISFWACFVPNFFLPPWHNYHHNYHLPCLWGQEYLSQGGSASPPGLHWLWVPPGQGASAQIPLGSVSRNQGGDSKHKSGSSQLTAKILQAAGLLVFPLVSHMKQFPFPCMSKYIAIIHRHAENKSFEHLAKCMCVCKVCTLGVCTC